MPWRTTKNPYKIWLSEVILQQTQVKQGLPYYEDFVNVYPTVFDLAKASEEEVLKLWQGLGYYSRARNMHETARYIANELGGQFPSTYEGLIALKGIGDYTASAIGSICFSLPTAVVDGNVYRVLARYFGMYTPINSSQGTKEFKEIAQRLIDDRNPGDYNQAIMEFGALQCKPTNPDCANCPLQDSCKAYDQGIVSELPVKLKKNKVKKKHYNYLVVLTMDGKTVLEQRRGRGIWQNLYQFPLIESDKSLSVDDLRKHSGFMDLLGTEQLDLELYNEKEVVHKLSHQHLYTKFWLVRVKDIASSTVLVDDLKDFPVPTLIGNFIEAFHFSHS